MHVQDLEDLHTWLHEMRQDSDMAEALVSIVNTLAHRQLDQGCERLRGQLLQNVDSEAAPSSLLDSAMDVTVGAHWCMCCPASATHALCSHLWLCCRG